MRSRLLTGVILGLVMAACVTTPSEAQAPSRGGRVRVFENGSWSVPIKSGTSASGVGTLILGQGSVINGTGREITPFATTAPITVLDGALTETVTPSAVSGCTVGSTNCLITATYTNAHAAGASIKSGSFGVQETINDLANNLGGGTAVIDTPFGGSTATITGATGSSSVGVEDLRTGVPVFYAFNGTGYGAVLNGAAATSSGALLTPFVNTELLTLATGATTTDTTANLLPANSIILAVTGRVTTTITAACTGWQLGDPTTAGRFTASNVTLAAGTTDFGKVALTTGVASATTGIYQTAAAKVRVTCATGNPGAGAIRITVIGFTLVPPAS